MVRPWPVAAVVVGIALGPRPAAAAEVPGPVCRQPNVLQIVAERLSRAGQPATLDVRAIGQVSDGSDRVRCAVWVHRIVYDTNLTGDVPHDQTSLYEYTLQLGRNGIFVLP